MIYSIVMVISMMGAYLIITTKELTVLRQFIALEVRAKINLQIIAEVGKLNHCVVIYRNAILSALLVPRTLKELMTPSNRHTIFF